MFTDPDLLDRTLHAVVEQELLMAPRRIGGPDQGEAGVVGELQVGDRRVSVKLVLPSNFPLAFPFLYLQPWDALGFIPHVLADSGYVCYVASEGLLLDRRDPVAIVAEAIRRTSVLLADGVSGANRFDFVDEFESYWSRLPNGVPIWSLLDPGTEVRKVVCMSPAKGWAWLAGSLEDRSALFNGRTSGGDKLTIQNAIYLPLEPDSFVLPPQADRPMWSVAEARELLLPNLSAENRARLGVLTRKCKSREYVFVSIPRPSSGSVMFGLRFDGCSEFHPLVAGATAEGVTPLQLNRLDKSYIVPRGGGEVSLSDKRVLIAGCGSVGGYLAFELVRAGVLDLTTLDPDKLSVENTFRHVLGWKHPGKNKAEALKAEIEETFPYVCVSPVATSLERALREKALDLSSFDLIVCALGNPTVELAFDEYLHSRPGQQLPAVYTWLEPFGIGGHAVATGNGPSGGCFACLYTSPIVGNDDLNNRAAFAVPDPGRPFARSLSGCGSLHTPYGSLDAMRTAALAAGLAVDILSGRESGNPLRSWKGDPRAYQEAGYEVSSRFAMSQEQLHNSRYSHQTARCPVCGASAHVTKRVLA
jgi:molybdopterin/thiamine biosynthesis adenylyltransferase